MKKVNANRTNAANNLLASATNSKLRSVYIKKTGKTALVAPAVSLLVSAALEPKDNGKTVHGTSGGGQIPWAGSPDWYGKMFGCRIGMGIHAPGLPRRRRLQWMMTFPCSRCVCLSDGVTK